MPRIKTGHTRISFDFRTPEGAIEFWENFKDLNPELGLVAMDALRETPSNGNNWLVQNIKTGNGRPVNYEQEFKTIFNIDIGTNPGVNVEV